MAPRKTRGRGVRAILVGVVFTLGAASLASQAATGDAPVMKNGTLSVASGWSKSNQIVGVEFNKRLAATSTATVKDLKTNTAVNGATIFADMDPITAGTQPGLGIAFQTAPGVTMIADGRNYEVVFTVTGSEEGGTPATTVSKVFKIDTLVPVPPRITSPTGMNVSAPCGVGCSDSTTLALEPVEAITGNAADQEDKNALEPAAATSGIAVVELRFYNVVDQAMNAVFTGLGDAGDAAFRVRLAQPCGTVCSSTIEEWSQALAELEDLGTGPWSVRAVAIDLAGNESAPSKAVTFIQS